MADTFKVRIFVLDEDTNESGFAEVVVRKDLMLRPDPIQDTKQNWAEATVLRGFVEAYRNLVHE